MAVIEKTVSEYLMGRQKDLTFNLLDNALDTVERVNKLLNMFGQDRKITSGYRTATINAAAGGAKKSNHMICKACDLEDKDGALDAWCMANLTYLEGIGLWLEHPDATQGWCHVQTVPPKSGNRVFRP